MSIINKPSATIASLLMLASGALFVFCYIISGGSLDESGSGAIWWLFLFFGIPSLLGGVGLFVTSIINGLNISKSVQVNGKNYGLGGIALLLLLAIFGYVILR